MNTLTGVSNHFHDVEIIAKDLLTHAPESFSANALGFLICDSQIDSKALVEVLSQKLPFPIVGGTTFTYPLGEADQEVSASFVILEKEGLAFSVAVTPRLCVEQSQSQVQDCYRACVEQLGTQPKLFIPFIPLVPGLNNDLFIRELFALAGEVPVFGGVTTDDLDTTKAAVFANGQVYENHMVLIALGGSIQPVFAVGSQVTVLAEYGPEVTKSDHNVVHRVDDMSFCDYMRSIGIAPEQRMNGVDALVQYGPLPCRLKNKLQDDHGVPELRCISYTNVDEGSAAFSSALPLGTRVNIGAIHKTDVVESSQNCLRELQEKIRRQEEAGYTFSALFSVPCVARYFAMLGGENLEKTMLTQELRGKMPVSMYYGFCEIAPTQGKDQKYCNRSHNASVIMCAL